MTADTSGSRKLLGQCARTLDLAGVGVVNCAVGDVLWGCVMDRGFYRQQAQRVGDLAEKADPFTKQRLLDLAVGMMQGPSVLPRGRG